MFEFDFCSRQGRHTLRTERRDEALQTLLSWGALRTPAESALGIRVGQTCGVDLGNGCTSNVRRVA